MTIKIKKSLSVFLSIMMLFSAFGCMTLTASAAQTYAVGDIIRFGSYPQTKVTDGELIAALDAVPKQWASYKYYYGQGLAGTSSVQNSAYGTMRPDDFMRFADITYGGEKYRAVVAYYFRPVYSVSGFSGGAGNQFKSGYYLNTTYYFKYEPLSWRVLDPASGLIVCENVIDAQEYQQSAYYKYDSRTEYFMDEECTVYANDYAVSSVRTWLNDDFYNTAFTDGQKANVSTYSYALGDSATVSDKISLLSRAEAEKTDYGFTDNASRLAQPTDYALCQGSHIPDEGNGITWWLRSPGTAVGLSTNTVFANGTFVTNVYAIATGVGVRPVCRLNTLKTDTAADTSLYSELKHTQQGHCYHADWTWADDHDSATAEITCPICYNVHETLTDSAPVLTETTATASVEIDGVVLTDTFNTVLRNGDTFRYGSYPKTRVKDPSLQGELAAVEKTFVSYGYYSGDGAISSGSAAFSGDMKPGDWMQFADFFYNGAKYRAVKIEKYRPHATQQICPPDTSTSSMNHQFLSGYITHATYYFLYEPLTWRVLDASAGLVMCEDIIDCQPYQNVVYSNSSGYWQGKSGTARNIHANCYATSTVHDWLNEHFYETAFTPAQKENVKTTLVDNTAYDSTYSSPNTSDKVFLLSYNESTNADYGFLDASTSDDARKATGTDYAFSQGLDSYGGSGSSANTYWLRSPSSTHSGLSAYRVSSSGIPAASSWVTDDYTGIRPACCLTVLKYDDTISSNLFSVPHNFSLSADQNVLTAECGDPDCELENGIVELTLNAPEKTVYADGKNEKATLDGLDAFNEAVGFRISEDDIVYSSGETVLSAAPSDVGDYTASLTLRFDGVTYTVSVSYSIAKGIPAYETPSDLSAVYGDALSSVQLPDGWRWVSPDSPVGGVGEHTFAAKYSTGNANYEDVDKTLTVSVSEKTLTVIADAKSKTYGDADPALTYTYEGLIEGDTITGALVRAPGNDVDTYAITQGTITAGDNYAISFTGANFTIGKKTLTVTADAKSKTYGDADPALTYTYDGLVENDAFTGELARAEGDDVDTYAITQGTLTAGDNYDLVFTGADFTITRRSLTVTADAKSKKPGEEDPELTYRLDGLQYDDEISVSLSRETGEDSGTYAINAVIEAGDNYDVNYVGASFTICAPLAEGACPLCGKVHDESTSIGIFISHFHLLIYLIKQIVKMFK